MDGTSRRDSGATPSDGPRTDGQIDFWRDDVLHSARVSALLDSERAGLARRDACADERVAGVAESIWSHASLWQEIETCRLVRSGNVERRIIGVMKSLLFR